MFDFEKLEVYSQARILVKKVLYFLFGKNEVELYLKDQLKRASTSITLNLAEGTGRMSKADKRHFYTISRSSVFECVSILQLLLDLKQIDQELYDELYDDFETISKMLLGMIRSLNNN